MIIRVRLFAVAKQLVGDDLIELNVPDGCTVEHLREQFAQAFPDVGPLLPHVLFAVGSKYVKDDDTLEGVEEIACIPPVSGG